MPDLTAHLSIDYGTATSSALLSMPDGRWLPVAIDGVTTAPSGIWLDPATQTLMAGIPADRAAQTQPETWLAEPLRHLGGGPIPLADRTLDPVNAVAAALRHIAGQATALAGISIGGLTLIMPCWWGPHRREQLRVAARAAGLPEPRLIADTIAIATHWAAWSAKPVTDGTCALITNAGAGGLTLAVVQQNPGGMHLLAHHVLAGFDAAHLDTALAAHLVARSPGAGPQVWSDLSGPARYHLLASVRAAKESLGQTARAAVLLPDPYPPAVLDLEALHEAMSGLREQLPDAVGKVLAAADTRHEDVQAVILAGGHAGLPKMPDTVRDATGLPPILVANPHAVAEGALRIAAPATAPQAAALPDVPPPRIHVGWRLLLAPGLLAITALTLAFQTVSTGWTRTDGSQVVFVALPLPQLGIAGMVAVFAAWSAATGITHLLHTAANNPAEQAASTRLARRAFFAAAATGFAVAAAFGVYTSAYFRSYQDTFARWPFLFAIPIATLTVVAGLLIARIPARTIPAWIENLRTPVTAVLVAAGGVLINRAGASGLGSIWRFGLSSGQFERLGMFVLGVGIALIIARTMTSRIILATALGLGFPVLYTYRTTSYYIWALATVITWWALTAALRTIRAASPSIDNRIDQFLRQRV